MNFQAVEPLGRPIHRQPAIDEDALPWLGHLRHPVVVRMREFEQLRDMPRVATLLAVRDEDLHCVATTSATPSSSCSLIRVDDTTSI